MLWHRLSSICTLMQILGRTCGKEGFYYDIDLGNDVVNDEVIAAIEKR